MEPGGDSLSRIYGGIHPPADDLPGRRIGQLVGLDAWDLASRYFDGTVNVPEPSSLLLLALGVLVLVARRVRYAGELRRC